MWNHLEILMQGLIYSFGDTILVGAETIGIFSEAESGPDGVIDEN